MTTEASVQTENLAGKPALVSGRTQAAGAAARGRSVAAGICVGTMRMALESEEKHKGAVDASVSRISCTSGDVGGLALLVADVLAV